MLFFENGQIKPTNDYFSRCVYDYLAIIDGDSTDSPALLVTCGAHYVGGGVTTQVRY